MHGRFYDTKGLGTYFRKFFSYHRLLVLGCLMYYIVMMVITPEEAASPIGGLQLIFASMYAPMAATLRPSGVGVRILWGFAIVSLLVCFYLSLAVGAEEFEFGNASVLANYLAMICLIVFCIIYKPLIFLEGYSKRSSNSLSLIALCSAGIALAWRYVSAGVNQIEAERLSISLGVITFGVVLSRLMVERILLEE